MNTPYGLEIVENCLNCRLRREECFCQLSTPVLKAFSAISHQTTYPSGATLFVEGQMPRGVFQLCSGKVKLSTTSRDGKVLILKMAGAGDALGLSAVISGTSYEMTAETAVPCHVNFVQREALLGLLQRHGEAGLRAAQTLSREFQSAYRDIHDLILARSSAGKTGQAAALLDTVERQWGEGDPGAVRADPRGDGADDRGVAGDGYAAAKRSKEEAADPVGRLDAGDPGSYGAGGVGLLKAVVIARN